jgi:hypothetical protein
MGPCERPVPVRYGEDHSMNLNNMTHPNKAPW